MKVNWAKLGEKIPGKTKKFQPRNGGQKTDLQSSHVELSQLIEKNCKSKNKSRPAISFVTKMTWSLSFLQNSQAVIHCWFSFHFTMV